MKNEQVIIVKKNKHGKHGHHGGAWKVAYADFVTAMMAFFLVMWIVSQSEATRAAVAAYFRDPGVFETTRQQGLLTGDASGIANADTPTDVMHARAALEEAAAELRRDLEGSPEFAGLKDNISIEVTAEGLRIELLETEKDGFFLVGSSALTPTSVKLLSIIAEHLGKLPNKVAIEGHTDSRPYHTSETFSNWELSSDRANAARREMAAHGLTPGQVNAVRGYADTKPRFPASPLDPRNRRVSILVQQLDTAAAGDKADKSGKTTAADAGAALTAAGHDAPAAPAAGHAAPAHAAPTQAAPAAPPAAPAAAHGSGH